MRCIFVSSPTASTRCSSLFNAEKRVLNALATANRTHLEDTMEMGAQCDHDNNDSKGECQS